ncbi:S-ribosylhomocysteine lyase [Brachybacterium sp. NBEC-018]|uniref:S-ribosylhomocysteine lyase n=1 Tax=Brachybacterium sp. NBEC-018 TaxID=2996004 RepID=UPI0021756126|nr:S-ribosylhomocysteine lyase [Brachybacterium sp. NBEC-018]UVY83194.1 S-ribosylhomocysteine lyase [Brachybacterium sp. NBEC-018]
MTEQTTHDEQSRMNVESFNLDHRTVAAPYVRIADRKVLPGGDVLTKFDLRFTQPNVDHLDSETVHSLEHLMAEHMRDHTRDVIDVSPMGCRTGFYALLSGDHTAEDLAPVLAATLEDVLAATEVPAANEVQCGWGAHHTLEGAQQAARAFLDRRAEWGTVTAG